MPIVGVGKREPHINWSMVKPEKAAPVTELPWGMLSLDGGLSAMNAICTQLRDLMN